MKKYHRLIIYVVIIGLTLSFFAALSVTISEKSKRGGNQPRGRNIGKRSENFVKESIDVDGQSEKIDEEARITSLIKAVEAENNNRLERIENICKKYGLGLFKGREGPKIEHPPVPQYSVFFIDKVNKFTFCPVYKAGSSTWLYNLCLLAGMTDEEIKTSNQQLSSLTRSKYPELEPEAAEEALQNTVKIMTVRHPFERLLSAYRDKLENTNYGREHGTLHFYKKFGKKIVNKYRKNGNDTKVWNILEPSQYLWNPEIPKPSGVEPTFQEFVRYLIDTNLIQYSDDHWIPYYLFCTPCLLHYNIIAKVETMNQDQLYAIRLLGLEDKIRPSWQHKTQFVSDYGRGDRVSNLAKIYFQQLSAKEVDQLYEKYKVDFELFGYDYKDYIQYARDYKKVLTQERK